MQVFITQWSQRRGHASPWHYQRHYLRQVASPTCQDAGVFFTQRASRERHGGHLLLAHAPSNLSTSRRDAKTLDPVAGLMTEIMA
jgi:hypothetical protein